MLSQALLTCFVQHPAQNTTQYAASLYLGRSSRLPYSKTLYNKGSNSIVLFNIYMCTGRLWSDELRGSYLGTRRLVCIMCACALFLYANALQMPTLGVCARGSGVVVQFDRRLHLHRLMVSCV